MTINDIDMFLQEIQAKRESFFRKYCNFETYHRINDINTELSEEEIVLIEACKNLDEEIGIIYELKTSAIGNPQIIEKAEEHLIKAQEHLRIIENQIQRIN